MVKIGDQIVDKDKIIAIFDKNVNKLYNIFKNMWLKNPFLLSRDNFEENDIYRFFENWRK